MKATLAALAAIAALILVALDDGGRDACETRHTAAVCIHTLR